MWSLMAEDLPKYLMVPQVELPTDIQLGEGDKSDIWNIIQEDFWETSLRMA